MKKFVSILVAASVASVASASLYSADFTGGAGSEWDLVGTGGLPTVPTIAPYVTSYNGSDQLAFEVPTDPVAPERTSALATLTLPTPVDMTALTEMEVCFQLTLPANPDLNQFGEAKRHNLYWDFNDSAFPFGDQTINDGGAVKMISTPGRGEINIGGAAISESIVDLRWVFDLTAGPANATVDTFYGATQVDNDLPVDLTALMGGTDFTVFRIEHSKDFQGSAAGYTFYVDDFKVTPEPASLLLLGLAGLALRRR